MQPDYLQYANKLMNRLRTTKRKASDMPPPPAPTLYIINAPQGCVININGAKPEAATPDNEGANQL